MFRVLNAVHPGKASMLSADAFKVKFVKMENKQDKRKKFAAKKKEGKNSASSGGTMDSQVIREERAMNLTDPLLVNINNFINEISESIKSHGELKKKEIETIYKNHGTTTTAGETKGYETHNQLDTIEENLAAIE